MSELFTSPSIDEVLNAEHNSGSVRISYKVRGYWSGDSITVYASRGLVSEGWEFNISHSSGGRDAKEVAEDEVASYNFAMAMIDACEKVKQLKLRTDVLDQQYGKFIDLCKKAK